MAKLAFYTFGILREARTHPQVQGFLDRTGRVLTTADGSAGMIKRSAANARWGEKTFPRFFTGDPPDGAAATLSLWEDLESVFAFAYAGVHAEALRHRKEWFVPPGWPTYVAWWVADGHTPDYLEAIERHRHLHEHGPTPTAFNFKHAFGPDGSQITIDRERIEAIAAANELAPVTED
jgi:hypothetical protein